MCSVTYSIALIARSRLRVDKCLWHGVYVECLLLNVIVQWSEIKAAAV